MPAKEIVYPIFISSLEYATDIFWKSIFEDLAYGVTPYGCYISNNYLCCCLKNKEFSYNIKETNDPELTFKNVFSLLNNKLGLLSSSDKVKKLYDFYKLEEDMKNSRNGNWLNIKKKKNTRDFIIENYIIDKKRKYNLKNSDASYLFSIIIIGLTFKTITSDDIVYENGKILDIEGITFKEGEIILLKDYINTDEIN